MTSLASKLDRALDGVIRANPGPGGACAVLREGEVLLSHAWGWANAERRIAWTPRTLFRICSITKQFTCATLLDQFPDPSVLDEAVSRRLPLLGEAAPSVLHLCHNQSGLRDYWAVAMLHGALAETAFGDSEARRVIGGTRTLQFTPGSRYSYCNQNFRLLSDILEDRTGRPFGDLLRDSVFGPAGMADAMLAANTQALPDGAEGYEGVSDTGFRPAENRIVWTGDAGVAASLEDMIAWERHIDATFGDADSIYRRLSAPVSFSDGTEATYGFGLGRYPLLGRPASGHNGSLRGWRSYRAYIPSERLSVVVMFNHQSDAVAAGRALLAAALGVQQPIPSEVSAPDCWAGAYVDPELGLSARIESAPGGRAQLRYGHFVEALRLQPDGAFGDGGVQLREEGGGLRMDRASENRSVVLLPSAGDSARDVVGGYRCEELDSHLTVFEAGGVLYGGFSGFLGQGRMEIMNPAGGDIWTLPCRRALDHAPPGEWSLAFGRDATGKVVSVEVGCWLARRLAYVRQE